MKIVGKPYSGKPNVRFDEGELEIELLATTPALYSTVICKRGDNIRQLKYWSGYIIKLTHARMFHLHAVVV